MKPKPQLRNAFELFQSHFSACAGTHADRCARRRVRAQTGTRADRDQLLDPRHELVQLAKMIDWPSLDVWAYIKDVLDRPLASETNYATLRPDA